MTATPMSQEHRGTRRRSRIRWIDVKEQLTGYLFILPSVLVIVVFGFFPIAYAMYMSTFSWRVRKGDNIGLDNYTKAIGDWTYTTISIRRKTI